MEMMAMTGLTMMMCDEHAPKDQDSVEHHPIPWGTLCQSSTLNQSARHALS